MSWGRLVATGRWLLLTGAVAKDVHFIDTDAVICDAFWKGFCVDCRVCGCDLVKNALASTSILDNSFAQLPGYNVGRRVY